MENKVKKDPIGIGYMIKKIYPMCYRAKPLYYIYIQCLNIIAGLSNGADLLVTQLLFDSVLNASIGQGTLKVALISLGLFLGLKLLSSIFEGMRQYAIEVHSSRVMGYMKSEIHKKSAMIDPIAYENPEYLDDINKAAGGTDSAVYFNTVTSFIVTYHLPYFVFMIWYLNSLSPVLILCLLFVFIPVLASHLFRSSILARLEDKSAPIRRQYDAYYDACCGKEFYKETRTLGAFRYLQHLLKDSITNLNEAIWGSRKKAALVDLGFNTLSLFGYGGVLLLSVNYMLSGKISVGAFAALFSSIDTLFSTMEYFIGTHLASIADNYGEIHNFLGFLQIPTSGRSYNSFSKKADISVQDASFRYPNAGMDSLHDINLTIRSGETVAIVGENGAGKTTLVKLLIGMYTPDCGNVKIGEEDLKNVSYDTLFGGMSGVFQKYQRYAMTLADNIKIADFNKPGSTDEIVKVLQESHIDIASTETFPDGLHTMLSREFDGVDLSGGQWQRVAIARGFYRAGNIIVLDEPTASIDPIEESNVYKEFAALAADKTAIIVTHRIGSARMAERIIVMKEGKIVEMGHHDELIRQNGVYAEMYKAQAKWYL